MKHFQKSFRETFLHVADILPVCMFFWWPPPKSIYLKTLTNSNYMGPLLWYAIFLSSPAIFDSLGRSASSCTQLPPRLLFLAPHPKVLQPFCGPLKENQGHQKDCAGLCRHEHRWTFLVSQMASKVVVCEGGWGDWVEASDPLWPFVCKRDGGPSPLPTQRPPRWKPSYWSPSSGHVPLLLSLPLVSFGVIPHTQVLSVQHRHLTDNLYSGASSPSCWEILSPFPL